MSTPFAFSPAHHTPPRAAHRQPTRTGPAASAAGYLVQRRGILHFRMRVPDSLRACLGCTELRRSLGTASLREARPRVMKLAITAHGIFTFTRECLAMRETNNGEDRGRERGRGWRGFDAQALATLTDQQI